MVFKEAKPLTVELRVRWPALQRLSHKLMSCVTKNGLLDNRDAKGKQKTERSRNLDSLPIGTSNNPFIANFAESNLENRDRTLLHP